MAQPFREEIFWEILKHSSLAAYPSWHRSQGRQTAESECADGEVLLCESGPQSTRDPQRHRVGHMSELPPQKLKETGHLYSATSKQAESCLLGLLACSQGKNILREIQEDAGRPKNYCPCGLLDRLREHPAPDTSLTFHKLYVIFTLHLLNQDPNKVYMLWLVNMSLRCFLIYRFILYLYIFLHFMLLL